MKFTLLFLLSAIAALAQTNLTSTVSFQGQTANGSITLTRQPKLTLTLTCPSSTIVSGSMMTCTATVNIAPNGSAVAAVALTSSDTTQITVQSPVTIPQGQTSAPFTVTAQ